MSGVYEVAFTDLNSSVSFGGGGKSKKKSGGSGRRSKQGLAQTVFCGGAGALAGSLAGAGALALTRVPM